MGVGSGGGVEFPSACTSGAADEEQGAAGGVASGDEDDEVQQGDAAGSQSPLENALRGAEADVLAMVAGDASEGWTAPIVEQLRHVVVKALRSLVEAAEVLLLAGCACFVINHSGGAPVADMAPDL